MELETFDKEIESREKHLPGYAYKLANNQFALDSLMISDYEIDERRMAVNFPFADGKSRDGVGDLLEVGGIRTDRHIRNPVVLLDHAKNYFLPVAMAEDPDTGAYTVTIDPISKVAMAKAFFYQGKGDVGKGQDYEHAVFCEQLFDLICKKYIR